ncbi:MULTISPECIES: class I SAM-dependent methyltransferase [Micromonospora]|uniref:class I SAM-dependent methyltransferase n=1 Tax=Micromonospora TaxID=1873 RepID=UPI0021C7A87E|nr:class I SAM-dependent methyltransferase [Micromonospora sp. Mcm103]
MTTIPSARAASQYATTTGNLTARMALHSYGTNPQDWFAWLGGRLPLTGDVLEVGAGTGELWRRVGRRGRLTLTDFSPAMCARLREFGPVIGRPDLAVRFYDRNDVTAEATPARVAAHLDDVTVERYPDELVVPAAEPILAYVASMIGPLTAAQEAAARAAIQARIDAEGAFRVRKHTVLISAARGSR